MAAADIVGSAPPPKRSRLAHRASWNLADQLVSSLSNFVLSLLVARSVSAAGYGAFALSFSAYSYALTLSRMLVTQPLTIRFSGAAKEAFDTAARQALGAALVTALGFGAIMVIPAVVVGGSVGLALASAAALLPGLLVQDAYRMIFFAAGHPAKAAVNDIVWALAMALAVLSVGLLDVASPVAYLWAWGVAGWVAAGLGVLQTRLWPSPRSSRRWLGAHVSLTRYSVSEVVVIVGSNQLTLWIVAALGGLSVVGALRGAQVLTAPSTIFSTSALAFAVPELARRPAMDGAGLRRAAAAISGVGAALMVLWCGILLLLPDSLGRVLLGATWPGTHAILVPTVIGVVAGTLGLGASAAIYARGALRVKFRWTVIAGPVYLVSGVVGVLVAGAYGAAAGLSLAAAYSSVVSIWRLVIVSRRPTAGPAHGNDRPASR